jgi:threonylcarbamoyladenosine tRNA methylthiotransferase MtaB
VSNRYVVKTLGCKANLYDSQLIEAELQRRGWVPSEDGDDSVSVCIVNSCTVTDEADRQSRKLAARLARENPGARIVMTGCSAEVNPELLRSSPGVDFVIGNRDKPKMADLLVETLANPDTPRGKILGVAESYAELLSRHPIDREWPAPDRSFFTPPAAEAGGHSRTRAFLKIQDGCNSFCTYCIIPYGRGPSRSLGVDEVVSQARELASRGVREIVLTGINLGDYGTDWSDRPQITPLIQAILDQTPLERLRVSSLDPVEIEPAMIELMSREPRFCPHFHVSLQSPHSRVLRLMKRKYAAEQVRECLQAIARVPAPPGGAFIGMDVITGFPGEGTEEFEASLAALDSLPWSRLHVFPYSERSGTPATRLPGAVPSGERARRARILRERSLERLRAVYGRALTECREGKGTLDTVLIEGPIKGPDQSGDWLSGYTSNYLRVLLRKSSIAGSAPADSLSNALVSVRPETLTVDVAAGDVALIARFEGVSGA